MPREQLIQECITREITEVVLSDGSGKVIRPKMIVAIREDVARRQQDPKNQTATSSAASEGMRISDAAAAPARR